MNAARLRPRRRSGRGFTLLEVLLAISIIILLCAAMFIFYDFSLDSRRDAQTNAEEVQLARAILDQMATDMTSVSAVTAFIRSRTVRRGFSVDGGDVAATPEGGMAGAYDSVAFLSSRPIPPARFVDADTESVAEERQDRPPLYDVNEVRWYWLHDAETGYSLGLYRAHRPAVLQRAREEDLDRNQISGAEQEEGPTLYERELAKLEGREIEGGAEGELEAQQQEADALLVTDRIAPEVQWIYLRYYNGSTWVTSFSGGPSGPSPLAVEITIGFSPLLSTEEIDSGVTLDERLAELYDEDNEQPLPARTYRRVVYLSSGEIFSGQGGGVRVQRGR